MGIGQGVSEAAVESITCYRYEVIFIVTLAMPVRRYEMWAPSAWTAYQAGLSLLQLDHPDVRILRTIAEPVGVEITI